MVTSEQTHQFSEAVRAFSRARMKVRALESMVRKGTNGRTLTKEAYKAMTRLGDAYEAMSSARAEVNRIEKQIKNELFDTYMYRGL